jgi:hypothetical protein
MYTFFLGDDMEIDILDEKWHLDQIGADLVTLAGLAPARWQNLHNLDVIKARNKPKEIVNRPQNAPFFLPTVTG